MKRRNLYTLILIITVAVIFAVGLSLLVFAQKDLSLHQNEKKTIFGGVYMTLNNPFYQIIDTEMRSLIEANNGILLTRNPSLNAERQQEQILELVDLGAKAIFVNPVDVDNIAPALIKAREKNVKIIAIDTNFPDNNLADCTIVSDNYLAGMQCGQHLLAHRRSAHIALLTHQQAMSAQERIDGFRNAIKDKSEFQVVATEDCLGQLELAMPAMEKILQEHPDVDVVMALNDPAAMGAVAALQHAGRLSGTSVYGVDGSPDVKGMIAHGAITATAGQEPRKIGILAVESAFRLLGMKNTLPQRFNIDQYNGQSVITLPTILLTRDNLSQHPNIGY